MERAGAREDLELQRALTETSDLKKEKEREESIFFHLAIANKYAYVGV